MNTNQITVHALRKAGFKLRVTHRRPKKNEMNRLYTYGEVAIDEYYQFSPKGGSTTVELRKPDGTEIRAEAVCSKKDAFNRKQGLQIALERAVLKALGV